MPFFKTRKGGDESAATPRQPESIEAMRRRARHRLIGAAVLVAIGVVGFPILFDTQPRPIAVDIPIQIPDRNKAKPLAAPAPVTAQRPATSGVVTPVAKVEAAPEPKAEAMAETKAQAKPEPKPEAKPEPKSDTRPAEAKADTKAQAVAKAEPKSDDGAKARALLEGKPVEVAAVAAPAEGRYVVQVGAFADPDKARETRLRVERAGLKTYTHEAQTKEGKRIRVRVGPFASRAEADKAADKIKGLDLPAAILTL
jgi:DedD protein